jgi:hypothetical protein
LFRLCTGTAMAGARNLWGDFLIAASLPGAPPDDQPGYVPPIISERLPIRAEESSISRKEL